MSSFSRIIIILSLLFCNCTTSLYIGRAISSHSFALKEKKIAIIYEFDTYNNIWFLQILTQSFIKNGYKVIERMQFEKVIEELSLDMSGAVAQDTIIDRSKGIFTPSKLKEIGKMYGIKYLVIFGKWETKFSYLRFIDCESAEVVANAAFADPLVEKFDITAADLLVLSIEYSAEINKNRKNPVYVYMEESLSKTREGFGDIDKILYQAEQKRDDYSVLYYLIYTKKEE